MDKKRNYNKTTKEQRFLRHLNQRFYSLITDLNKSGFTQTSQAATFAYEHFWKELSHTLNYKRFN